MTKLRIDGALGGDAGEAIDAHVARLYAKPGARIMGIVELRHVERVQPAPDEGREASVKLAIKHLEVGVGDQDEVLRKALRALFLQRTAIGTLDPDGEVELAKSTLEQIPGILGAVESARLRVVLKHWADYSEKILFSGTLSTSKYQTELRTIADGIRSALARNEDAVQLDFLKNGSGVHTSKK